ncbi:MAG TPA: tol-pal system protein YbgF [Thermoanaerobaculia bacterium]|nr:tol-pal system protein YbgF [Thermoanaerobaculia bacterium]
MKTSSRAWLAPSVLLLASSLLAGCASTGTGNGSQEDQIRELQARVLELQRKAAVNEVELARLRQQVADLEARQGGAPAGARGPGAASAYPVPLTPLAQTPAPSSGASPERAARAGSTRSAAPPTPGAIAQGGAAGRPASASGASSAGAAATRIDQSDIDVPVARTGPSAPTRPATPPAAAAGAPPPSSSPAVPPGVQALYDRGYTLYHQKHYIDAEASFQRFLQAAPQSDLADNAQYWIGECRYSRGDMRGALAAFREAVDRYPAGNKAPDALLKAGMSLESLGDTEGARNTYKDVIRRFPGTAVAAVAEERRAKLP